MSHEKANAPAAGQGPGAPSPQSLGGGSASSIEPCCDHPSIGHNDGPCCAVCSMGAELEHCREVYERALAAERETIASVRAALAQAVEELEAWRRCHDAANRGDTAAEDRELTEALRLRATSGGERG